MFSLKRKPLESWREAAGRYGGGFGIRDEVLELYDDLVGCGIEEEQAAFEACLEWDVLDIVESDSPPETLNS